MVFIGLFAPVVIGWWLIGKRRANTVLALIGLAALPIVVWGASLGAKIGSCGVPDCMSSTQHDHLVITIVSLVLLLASYGLLAVHRASAGGALLAVALVVGAYSMATTDTAALVMLVLFALAAATYVLLAWWSQRQAARVPDFPPVA
jgi:NADH:ubiquinone oxidoreductase subunit 2 (subunit N)